MALRILPISAVRSQLAVVLKEIRQAGQPCFLTKNGRAVAALLPIETYEHLMSELEDRLDETDPLLAKEIRSARREHRTGKRLPWRSRRK